MKKSKNISSSENELQLRWEAAKKARQEFQETLLQAKIEQALDLWLHKARVSFDDRGTITNYYAYIKDLLQKGILSPNQIDGSDLHVCELNDLHDEILDRINECESFKLNDRRYRLKALIAFIKFLNDETEGKIQKLSAPPIFMTNDSLPELANPASKPQVLTEEEFRLLCEKIKSPKQRDQSSFRDYLVIEIMYQTARPLPDILALQKANIDITNECIIFFNKSKDYLSVPINSKLANGLKLYLEYSQNNRKDETVFITREGNPIFRTHFYQVLKQASLAAELGFTATFKMIQWAFVIKRIMAEHSAQKVTRELKLKKIPKNLESIA